MKKFLRQIGASALAVAVIFATGCFDDGKKTAGTNSTTDTSGHYVNSDFVPSDENSTLYETSAKSIGRGMYQVDESDLTGECLELTAGYITAGNKSDFEAKVAKFKEKLDILESKYAFGYSDDEGTTVDIKIEGAKLGLPVFALLNVTSTYSNKIYSQMGDLEINTVENLSYTLNADSAFEITVEIPERDRETLQSYISKNPGAPLYFKCGELTFSHVEITPDMPADKITFTGFDFLGSNVNEADYEYIMKLAQHNVNESEEGAFTMSFPTFIEDDTSYSLPYVTPMDEIIISKVNSLYSDAQFIREDVRNRISIKFDVDPSVVSVEECLARVQTLYGECSFDDGAYSSVAFKWLSDEEYMNNYVIFTKRDGKMICTGYPDRIAADVETHPFISGYIEK